MYNWCQHFGPCSCLPLPFGAAHWCLAASWKWIYIRGFSIMIQWKVEEDSPEGMNKVLQVIGNESEQEWLFRRSLAIWAYFRILPVCVIREEQRMAVSVGRWDIYTWVPCNFLDQLVIHDNFDSYPAVCCLINSKLHSLHLGQPLGNSSIRSLEIWFNACSQVSYWRQALLLH